MARKRNCRGTKPFYMTCKMKSAGSETYLHGVQVEIPGVKSRLHDVQRIRHPGTFRFNRKHVRHERSETKLQHLPVKSAALEKPRPPRLTLKGKLKQIALRLNEQLAPITGTILQFAESSLAQVNHILHRARIQVPYI